MDKQDFKVRIVNFYKDVDKPMLNSLYNDNEVKDILVLSTKTDFPLLQKDKNGWNVKNKGKLLKDIDSIKKKKVKEFTSVVNNYHKDNTNIDELKNNNNKMISELESIDNLKKSLGNEELYLRLQNLALLNNNTIHKSSKTHKPSSKNKVEENDKLEKIKLNLPNTKQKGSGKKPEDIKPIFSNKIMENKLGSKNNLSELSQLSSDSEDYIEVFSNSLQ